MDRNRLPETEVIAILNLLAVPGIGSATVLRLVEHFGSAAAAFGASETRLRTIPRFTSVVMERLKAVRPDAAPGKQQLEQARKAGVEVVTYWDADYPPALRELETDAPSLLFIRGGLPPEAVRLAVVGTRRASVYGTHAVKELITGLRESGIHVVSGLASGIDGKAHEAALDSGLKTEAVFGCGVGRIYPPAHAELARRILDSGGALLSEFPMNSAPEAHHFPQRNRIIAGLCRATLVVEAGERSGALITANLAAEYNREVMAVPGPITSPKSRGCNELIKCGAALVESPQDVLDAMRVDSAVAEEDSVREPDLPEADRVFIHVLDPTEGTHIDMIAEKIQMPVGEALSRLLMLELKGAVKQLPGKYFVRA